MCPGCERGCSINIWHRKSEWKLQGARSGAERAHRPRHAAARTRPSTARGSATRARDLAQLLRARRAPSSRCARASPSSCDGALASAARADRRGAPAGGAGVELGARTRSSPPSSAALGARFACFVKADQQPAPGEVLEDDLLIRADKNPNTRRGARAVPAAAGRCAAAPSRRDSDLVLVWGEGFSFAQLPPQAKIIYLNSWLQPENGHADVFLPISVHDRAQRPLHQLPGRGQRLRGLLRQAAPAWPMPRRCSPRWRAPAEVAHDPGPGHLRSSSSPTRWAC